MPKFKKGDRVRVTKEFRNANSPQIPVGAVGTIEEDNSRNPIVRMDYAEYNSINFTGYEGQFSFQNEDSFELLSDAYRGLKSNIIIQGAVDWTAPGLSPMLWEKACELWTIQTTINKITKSFMSTLRKIPAAIKKILSAELQALYRAAFINEDLSVSTQGKSELLQILAEKYQTELAARANEFIKEVEAEEAKNND